MADLRVDDGVLADSERRLNRLHAEFGHLDWRRDDLDGVWGAPAVAAAMGGFFDNWSHYRKRLLLTIEAVGGMVTDTRSAFREADRALASSLNEQRSGPGGGAVGDR